MLKKLLFIRSQGKSVALPKERSLFRQFSRVVSLMLTSSRDFCVAPCHTSTRTAGPHNGTAADPGIPSSDIGGWARLTLLTPHQMRYIASETQRGLLMEFRGTSINLDIALLLWYIYIEYIYPIWTRIRIVTSWFCCLLQVVGGHDIRLLALLYPHFNGLNVSVPFKYKESGCWNGVRLSACLSVSLYICMYVCTFGGTR